MAYSKANGLTPYYCEPIKGKIRISWDGYNCVVQEYKEGIVSKGPYRGKPFSGWYFFGYWPSLGWFLDDAKSWVKIIEMQRKEAKKKDTSDAFIKNLEFYEERLPTFEGCLKAFINLDVKTELAAMKSNPDSREFSPEHKEKIAASSRSRKGIKLGKRKK